MPTVVLERIGELDLIVRNGETLSAIARKYGTSVQNLQKINNLRGTLIVVGQALRIPSRGGASSQP